MKTTTLKGVRMICCAVCLLMSGCRSNDTGDAPHEPPNRIASASDLSLPGLDGHPVALFNAPGSRAFVFFFIRTDCPISNRYAPEMERLQAAYSKRGIVFHLVYPEPDDTADAARAHCREYHLTVPALLDPGQRLTRKAGARVTPEAAVFLPRGDEVYLGRIDDRFADFGTERRVTTKHDLADTLDRILSGLPVAPYTNRAVGCYISEK